MKNLKVTHLNTRQVLKISGQEARTFLQGLVSNDLMRVSETNAIYAALLTPQGKYLHDFFISEFNNNFYLDCEGGRIDDLFKRLRMYKLRANIELTLVYDMTVVVLFGEGVHKALSLKNVPGSSVHWLGGILFNDPRLNKIGLRAILPTNSLTTALCLEGFTNTEFEDYDVRRINLGLPDGSRDMIVDKSILLEGGFEELNGVDFNKGCYVGQELTARTKHRGLIKKRLIPMRFDSIPPINGTEIIQNGKSVGELRSVVGLSALALLRLEALNNSNPLSVNGHRLVPQKPSWMNF
jgi:folate-binding protein YgfZ